MDSRVFWLKPSRSTADMPEFPAPMPIANLSRGVETCAVLDLNILNTFHKHLTTPPDQRSEELRADILAIKKILDVPGMFVAAGFALGEADEAYLEGLVESYEEFFATELPTFGDAPNAIAAGQARQRSRKYKALPADDRQFLSSSYLALLKVHEILVTQPTASPEAMFDDYLEYMDRVADLVPGVETEVAKHCFFKAPGGSTDPFLVRSRAIRKNFDKGGKGEARVDRVLNGARDVMYLRSAAVQDGRQLDGRVQDTWLLTSDAGLAGLCASIHFVPKDGERAKFTTLARHPTRDVNSYWRYVDRASNRVLLERDRARHGAQDFVGDAFIAKLTQLALELNDRLTRLSQRG